MKKVILKELKLTNFKGIKSLSVDFNDQTDIYGANGTGKTSVFDAFTWLLFGKDSSERANFEIKTLDSNNNAIPKIEHEVEAVIMVDDKTVTLRRTLKEKWTTRRGSSEAEFTGNETLYHWNDVPIQAGDFSNKVSEIVDEKVFKLITSPTAFNSLKWQDQRDVLISICGEITDEQVAGINDDFIALIEKSKQKDVSIEDLAKTSKASLKKAKDELKTIPTRIDEVERGKLQPLDFDSIKNQILQLNADKNSVEAQIANKLEAQNAELEKKAALKRRVYELENEVSDRIYQIKKQAKEQFLEFSERPTEIKKQIESIDANIATSKNTIDSKNREVEQLGSYVRKIDLQMSQLREQWHEVNARTFTMDEKECKCPTCKRAFDMEIIDDKRSELERMFNDDKRTELAKIDEKGKSFKIEKEGALSKIETLKSQVQKESDYHTEQWKLRADLSEELASVNIEDHTESNIYNLILEKHTSWLEEKRAEIDRLNQTINSQIAVNVDELKAKKSALQIEIDNLNKQLYVEQQIKDADTRIEKLKSEEEKLATSIVLMEKELYTIEQFTKAKMDTLEANINSRFRYVNFKLFETQINGGETPTCKALINGVPFSDANTASKINAGIDIINTLCEHYDVSAPIFIDNRESVTEVIECQSQIVNLIVSPEHKSLTVKSNESQAVANY